MPLTRAIWPAAMLAIATLASACDPGGRCGPTEAVVARVIDGDTVELESGERVRYLMIDTPEVGTNAECYGDEARRLNAELVEGKTVKLRYDRECLDRFDRTLAYVSIDGRDLSELMVERGYACVLHISPNGDDRVDDFEALERAAKSEARGLWGACEETPC